MKLGNHGVWKSLTVFISFRWVKPAASLKLAATSVEPLPMNGCFRWVKPAASLKRVRVRRNGTRRSIGFRWVKPAASLKHLTE